MMAYITDMHWRIQRLRKTDALQNDATRLKLIAPIYYIVDFYIF